MINSPIFEVATIIIFLIFLYRIFKGYVTFDEANNKLINCLAKKGNSQIQIYKLNASEKLKYGVPVIPLIGQLYRLEPLILNLKYVVSFKIEYLDTEEKEWSKYVEIMFKNKEIISYFEFDSFEI